MNAAASRLDRRQALARLSAMALLLPLTRAGAQAAPFDHSHAAWTALLKKHVVLIDGGRGSQLRYAGMAADRAALKSCTDSLSAVSAATFNSFSKPQQMAFLINAYNTFTVELILTRYPKLASIRDLAACCRAPGSPSSSTCWAPRCR